jgi:hypothetical protein
MGMTMQTPRTVLLLSLLVVSFSMGQSSRRSTADDNFTQRLEKEIDRFIDRFSRGTDPALDDTLDRKRPRSMKTADLNTEDFARSYTGNTTIEADERVDGDVVVKGGNLTVYGTVEGDVLVIGGNLYVKEDGHVTGNARVINGTIEKSGDGRIDGYEDRSNGTASYRTDRSRFRHYGTSFDVPWLNEFGNFDNAIVRYNRVEGIFLGIGSEKKFYWDGRRSWAAFGSVGWGFKSHTWRYNLGLARQFPLVSDGGQIFELGVEGYSLTDSKDRWIISTNENSAAAFFIHEDFLDYFSRRGGTGHVAWLTQGSVVRTEVRIGYSADRYDSLVLRTDWALFGGEKRFRPNPPVTEGKMRSVNAAIGFTTTEKTSHGPEGWTVTAAGEFGKKMTGSEFSFNQYVFDLRRYQPLGRYDNINVRVRVGSAEGILPPQKMFELGGLGTLHAYRYKQDAGNRMVLANAEYIVDGNFLDDLDFWPSDLFGGINFLFLSDAGLVRTLQPTAQFQDGFGKITWGELRHNLGVGLANRNGTFRVAYTWRTTEKAPGTFTFRFVRPF